MRPKIAVLTLARDPNPLIEGAVSEVAERLSASAVNRLSALGAEVMSPVPIVVGKLKYTHCVNGDDACRAVAQANAWKADCVILLVVGFHTPGLIVNAVRDISAPLVLWGVPNPTGPLVGAILDRALIVDLGIRHLWLYGEIEGDCAVRAYDYARGAMVAARLRGATYGLVGGRAYDMENTIFDPAQLLKQFGVITHHMDQLELYFRAEAQDPARVREATREFIQGKEVIDVPELVMERSIRTYLALHDMTVEYKWDFVGVKDQPEMIHNYCSTGVAVACMNDVGIPTVDECDTPGAVTAYMMSLLVDEPVWMGDAADVDVDTQIMPLLNGGNMATRLARPDVPVKLTQQYEFMGRCTGVSTTYQCKPGGVTVARLQRAAGKHSLLMTPAEVVNRPESDLVLSMERWPHAFVKLPGNGRNLIEHLLSNHLHIAYGDLIAPLTVACQLLEVEPLII